MFKKSSRCAADKPQCVEVQIQPWDQVEVRDSKHPNRHLTLCFTREEWAAFIEGVKAGEFDVAAVPAAV